MYIHTSWQNILCSAMVRSIENSLGLSDVQNVFPSYQHIVTDDYHTELMIIVSHQTLSGHLTDETNFGQTN